MRIVCTMVILLVTPCAVANTVTTEYLLGDVDNFFYEGTNSEDHVYVDPGLWAYADLGSPARPFDIVAADQDIPFTFLFPLAPGEEVVGATLELRLKSAGATNEWLCIHPDDGTLHWAYGATHWAGDHYTVYRFADELGWTIPSGTSGVFTADLANIDGDNRLPWLQDGDLNIHITDDFGVDYAKLTVTTYIVPEPLSVFSGLIGLGMVGAYVRRRRRKMA